jgi:hypothetical protein
VSKNRETTSKKLKSLLASVFDQLQDVVPELRARHRHNFVFHMTDWIDDLDKLQDLYRRPEAFSKDDAAVFIAGFLYHVVPHLRAAGRLALDLDEDVFKEIDSKSP